MKQEATTGQLCFNEICKEDKCQVNYLLFLSNVCAGKIRFSNFSVIRELESKSTADIHYKIYGFLSKESYKSDAGSKKYRIYASVVDIKTGKVVATDDIWIENKLDVKYLMDANEKHIKNIGFGNSGLAYLLREISLPEAPPTSGGEKAKIFVQKVKAIRQKYEEEKNNESLKEFKDLQYDIYIEYYGKHDEKSIQSQREIYINFYNVLSLLKQNSEAKEKLRKVIHLDIEASHRFQKEIKIPFFFKPNSTDLDQDLEEIEESQQWLEHIVDYFVDKEEGSYCLFVVGHSSKSGAPQYNTKLSLERAKKVEELLKKEFSKRTNVSSLGRIDKKVEELPSLKSRTEGKGFDGCIVCTGTNNSFDIVDRRVELKLTEQSCPELSTNQQ